VVASPLARPGEAMMRVGLIVPRHRQSAVARNRLKRRLRELVRLQLLPSRLPFDVVVRARAESYDSTFEQLSTDIGRVHRQLERWAPTALPADTPPSTAPSTT
jgi:ribonuclease P protein component